MSLPIKIDFFINPVVMGTVLLTGLNDHYLKYKFPGFITGKISDFLGLFYFPLFCAAIIILMGHFILRKTYQLNKTMLFVFIVLTDIVFVILKLNHEASQSFSTVFSEWIFKIKIVNDPIDLIALVSSYACYLFARSYFLKN